MLQSFFTKITNLSRVFFYTVQKNNRYPIAQKISMSHDGMHICTLDDFSTGIATENFLSINQSLLIVQNFCAIFF